MSLKDEVTKIYRQMSDNEKKLFVAELRAILQPDQEKAVQDALKSGGWLSEQISPAPE